MASVKPSVKALDSLRKLPSRYLASVAGHTGLWLRVQPTGTKTFVHRFKLRGTEYNVAMGKYPAMSLADALAKHSRQRQQLDRGENPATEVQREQQRISAAPTMRELAALYIERHAKPYKRTAHEDELMLAKDVFPRLGKIHARDVTRQDVLVIVERIQDRGAQQQARKTLAVLKRMFRFAIERGVVESSPCSHLSVRAGQPRDRILSEDELHTFWNQLDNTALNAAMRDALRLQLLTAQRIGEVLQMKWENIDLSKRRWTITATIAKNRRSNVLPLTDEALAIIARQPRGNSESVFASHGTKGHLRNDSLAKALNRSLPQFVGEDGRAIQAFATHDLRRTAATMMAGARVSREVLNRILNHVDASVTGRHYDLHRYEIEMRQALERWQAQLKTIANSKRGNKIAVLRRGTR